VSRDDQDSIVRSALQEMHVHTRIREQGLAPEGAAAEDLIAAVPALSPFGSNKYASVRAIIDWDHQLPSKFSLLRIYIAYSGHEARRLDTQIRAREQAIRGDNLYPEFDLPDYADLEASETYVGVIRPGSTSFEEFRFFASWRKEVRAPIARNAVAKVKQLELYKEAYRLRQNDALGSAIVVGWAPPCLANSDHWAVEIWLVVEFDGQRGRAQVFMIDSETLELTHNYQTDVHVA
jgi:hypothetical protein